MNERATENIVRDHFNLDPLSDVIKIEEQKTNVPRVQKCLANASKHGTGKIGRPEFIITIPAFPDDIIVVECKADIKYHESKDRKTPVNYSVDGVLHYARFLSEEYNVFSIAVSGTKENHKVSSFYQKKGKKSPTDQDNQLLGIYSYLEKFKGEVVAETIESEGITKLAIEINKELNDYSVMEYDRCTLVSAVLLALHDETFRKSYQSQARDMNLQPRPDRLARLIVDTIGKVLEENGIDEKRASTMIGEYKAIENKNLAKNTQIKKKKTKNLQDNFVIRDITQRLELKILPLINMGSKGYDVLGRFYTEFIRYAGADKKVGLVLTPKHITEFFCDIVDLGVDDVVFDSCCGTGGFLVSAMKRMLGKAGNNEQVKNTIKEKQLLGIEIRTDMFTFACANMMMSGDGKSHIYEGDSDTEESKKKIMKMNPTVGFLNPPYDSGKAKQLEYIETMLSYLKKGGRCVAIVQMSCATSAAPATVQVRKRILEKHTLKAVFSMPDDLFYPVGVVTCIMVFEAGKPHPDSFKPYFGYYKDDGFIKQKNFGRRDKKNQWAEIKKTWVNNFVNLKSEPGISVTQEIKASSDWCAEAYMKTDYSKILRESFCRKVREYLAYKVNFGLVDLSAKGMNKNVLELDIDVKKWKNFKLISDDVCISFKRGTRLVELDRIPGQYPLVTAGETDLGVKMFISNDEQTRFKEKITIDMFCNSFCHIDEFCCDDNIITLTLTEDTTINPYIAIFLNTVIEQDKYRYQYGRQYRMKHLKKHEIKLPVKKNGKPDWEFMENYIKSLPYSDRLV